MRTTAIILSFWFPFSLLHAQDHGFDLTWENDLSPKADTLTMDTVKFVADRITVFEADEGDVNDAWKAFFAMRSSEVSKSGDLLKVSSAQFGDAPTMDLSARIRRDKKSNTTDLVLASTTAGVQLSPEAAKEVAVGLNKWVVEQQVAVVQEDLDKIDKDLGDLDRDHEKASDKGEDHRDDLAKIQDKVQKNAREAEKMSADIQKMQRKYDISKDPKLLSKISKEQASLAKLQKKNLDLMEDQEKASKKMDKQAGDVPDIAEERTKLQAERDKVASELSALKAKSAAIH